MLVDGWPWGWGAVEVIGYPADGWRCPECGWKAKRRKNGSTLRGCHFYADGSERCSACARAWCEAHYQRAAVP